MLSRAGSKPRWKMVGLEREQKRYFDEKKGNRDEILGTCPNFKIFARLSNACVTRIDATGLQKQGATYSFGSDEHLCL